MQKAESLSFQMVDIRVCERNIHPREGVEIVIYTDFLCDLKTRALFKITNRLTIRYFLRNGKLYLDVMSCDLLEFLS